MALPIANRSTTAAVGAAPFRLDNAHANRPALHGDARCDVAAEGAARPLVLAGALGHLWPASSAAAAYA